MAIVEAVRGKEAMAHQDISISFIIKTRLIFLKLQFPF